MASLSCARTSRRGAIGLEAIRDVRGPGADILIRAYSDTNIEVTVVGYAVIQVLSTTASVWAADFGTPEEAKAMLERAVAAVKEDKAKALDMFNNGEGGFKDRDLYVWCANASDGIVTAQPYMH